VVLCDAFIAAPQRLSNPVAQESALEFECDQLTGSRFYELEIQLRELSRFVSVILWDEIHSPEGERHRKRIKTSPKSIREFGTAFAKCISR
jgi:hypothetical protein